MVERAGTTDFVVDWKNSQEETVKEIIQRIFLNDIDGGMPTLVVFTGRSGSGKSYSAIKVQQWLYEKRELNYVDYIQHNIVLSPLEYGNQIKEILQNPEFEKIFTIQIDEGRFVVGAENWGTFVNATIGHVNASARAIRVMATFIITQSLRDIDKKLRDTINMQVICRKDSGQVHITFRKFWIDDSDVENPRLRYRTPIGTIRYPDGSERRVKLTWKPKMIRRELWEQYEEKMRKAKSGLINAKMDRLIEKIKKDMGETNFSRAEQVAETLFKNEGKILTDFGSIRNGHWYPNAKAGLFGLNESEMKSMKKSLDEKLKVEAIERVTKKPVIPV